MVKLRKADYCVKGVSLRMCQEMVAMMHYAKGGSNTATFSHGLFRKDAPFRCLGVAWWIPPTKTAAHATYPEDWRAVLSLSRLVIRPEVPTNGASFLLAQSTRLIRLTAKWKCLVTYADEWRGHTGAIYRAANWEYVGKTTPETVWVDGEDRMVARKAGPKTRTKADMEALGYRMVGRFSKHKFRLLIKIHRGGRKPPEIKQGTLLYWLMLNLRLISLTQQQHFLSLNGWEHWS